MNKREFVLGGTAWAVTALAETGRSAAAAASRQMAMDRPDLTAAPDLESWRHYVGERFDTEGPQARGSVLLERIADRRADQNSEQFTLAFRTESGANAPAGLHSLRHANGRRVALFLDPANSSSVCVAHFNRLK